MRRRSRGHRAPQGARRGLRPGFRDPQARGGRRPRALASGSAGFCTAMDDSVLRSLAKWPDVPAVYGWLALDRRGNWLLRATGAERFERIANRALREFIARNYEVDSRGCWFFQNGPQRVYVRLAYTPYVVHFEGNALMDQCGRASAET